MQLAVLQIRYVSKYAFQGDIIDLLLILEVFVDAWIRQGGRKMIRKSLIAIILLSLMPVSIQATRRAGSFDSIFFLPQKRCVIPVKMDIGMYVEILDMEKLSIKLKQLDFDTFEGCTNIRIKSNFDLELGCKVKPTGMVKGEYSCSFDNPKVPLDLSENVVVREICVKAEKVKILFAAPGKDIHVADVTITILPES
jgi:hypothetical protein